MGNKTLYFPISQKTDLDQLNDDEVVQGYIVGIKSIPLPNEYTRSYWHGWKNGMVDAGKRDLDVYMKRLARECYPRI